LHGDLVSHYSKPLISLRTLLLISRCKFPVTILCVGIKRLDGEKKLLLSLSMRRSLLGLSGDVAVPPANFTFGELVGSLGLFPFPLERFT
jgi:hypothetical protein